MAKLIFLGTAGAVASREKDNSCFLLLCDKERILIDCSGSLIKKLALLKIKPSSIRILLFTHTHPDHLYGLPSFIHSQYSLTHKIKVFASKSAIKKISSLIKLFDLDDKTKFPSLKYQAISLKDNPYFYESEGLKISAFRVKHAVDSLGFKIFLRKEGICLVFSGDTSPTQELIKASKNIDILVHDCFSPSRFFRKYPHLKKEHTSSLALGDLAREAKVKTLIPIHLATEINYSLDEVKKEIRKSFQGKIVFVNDLEVLKLISKPF